MPGTGLGALGYVLRHVTQVGRPAGGSGALTDALASGVASARGRCALLGDVGQRPR